MRRRVIPFLFVLGATGQAEAAGLRQDPGRASCVQEAGEQGCRVGHAIGAITELAVAPDGRHLYAGSADLEYGSLVTLRRDRRTGTLRQLRRRAGCISSDGRDEYDEPRCAADRRLGGVLGLAIAGDGRTIFVSSLLRQKRDSFSLLVYRRDRRTGRLRRVQCLRRIATPDCSAAPLTGAADVAIAPGGRELLVGGSAIRRFPIDPDGRLGSGECLVRRTHVAGECPGAVEAPQMRPGLRLAVSPDGTRVFSTAGEGRVGQVMAFGRDPATGALTSAGCAGDAEPGAEPCAEARGLDGPNDLAVSPDGRSVYVTAEWTGHPEGGRPVRHNSALTVFAPDPFTQLPGDSGCLLHGGFRPPDGCAAAGQLRQALSVAVTPDGRHVLAAFLDSAAVVLLARDRRTQRLRRVRGRRGCIHDRSISVGHRLSRGACRTSHGMTYPYGLAISPDGRHAYVASLPVSAGGIATLRITR